MIIAYLLVKASKSNGNTTEFLHTSDYNTCRVKHPQMSQVETEKHFWYSKFHLKSECSSCIIYDHGFIYIYISIYLHKSILGLKADS